MKTEPKTMTQDAFDALPEAQKTFYRSLVETGQFVIAPPPAAIETPQPEEQHHDKQRWFAFSQFRNKLVIIRLMDGSTITGTITDVWIYEIGIKTETGKTSMIMKAGILTVGEP